MSCVLRVEGHNFDVDTFLAKSTLPSPCTIYHKGTKPFQVKGPLGRPCKRSGVTIPVSEAPFSHLANQVKDAILFLRNYEKELRKLWRFPGVETMRLDFGIARRPVFAQFEHLPKELIQQAGKIGLEIEISIYTISNRQKRKTKRKGS